jgi:hypothetical protein
MEGERKGYQVVKRIEVRLIYEVRLMKSTKNCFINGGGGMRE